MSCLRPRPGETVLDCTIGYGGHAREFLGRILPGGELIGVDRDLAELERTRERLSDHNAAVSLHHGSFAGIQRILRKEGAPAVDVVFADLGASSMQLDDPRRGFSYKHDGPLDMRMDPRIQLTAADWLKKLSAPRLAGILRELGDEPEAEGIAGRLVEDARTGELRTTRDLVRAVLAARGISLRDWRRTRRSSHDPHPAGLVFQALRMHVNDEVGQLEELLRVLPDCLRPRGRMAILSFHSGEDRRVKQALREGSAAGVYREISAEVQRPTPVEVRGNPRSASARLRWAIRA